MNRVEGNDRWWCNKCVAWGEPIEPAPASAPAPAPASAPVSAPASAPAFKPGRVSESSEESAAPRMFFWLFDGLFVVAGLVALIAGWTKLGVGLIAFGVLGGLFLVI